MVFSDSFNEEEKDNSINTRNKNPVSALQEAVTVVTKIVRGVETEYFLVPWKNFEKNWEKKALVHCEFEMLCLSNTL